MWCFAGSCGACQSRLAWADPGPFCSGCAPAAERAGHWCAVDDFAIASGWAYSGPLQAWVERLKNGEFVDPSPLVAAMRPLVQHLAGGGPMGLVAMPPERGRLQKRGLHLPDLLVGALAIGSVQRVWGLERLDHADPRRDRVREPPVLRASKHLPALPLVVVDDVVTTGQSVNTARQALIEAGALVIGAVCLADARPTVLARVLSGID